MMGRLDLFVGGDGGSVAVVISGAVGVCGSFKCGLWSGGSDYGRVMAVSFEVDMVGLM